MRHYITTYILFLFAAPLQAHRVTDSYKVFNYQQAHGLPGNTIYYLYQDSRDYIWIGTQNGLVSFNGYEFKTYTVKDGLPDNEIITIKENRRSGKLWLIPFSNEVCYMWKGKIYNADNDSLLRQLKFSSVPRGIEFDKWGNTWISETGSLTLINSKGQISKIDKIDNERFLPVIPLRLDDSGRAIIVNETKYYRYNGSRFELIAELPIHPFYHYNHSVFLELMLEEFRWSSLPDFIKRYKSGESYYQGSELTKIFFSKRFSDKLIATGSNDGVVLKDIRTGKSIMHFLEGKDVSSSLFAKDGTLWFGTLSDGLFHYFPSFIKSIVANNQQSEVSFIKVDGKGLYFIKNRTTLVQVRFNAGNQPEIINEKVIGAKDKTRPYSYVGMDRLHNWIVCEAEFISKYKHPGAQPSYKHNIGYSKSVFEEDDNSLIIGTVSGIIRLNKDKFSITDTLYDKRVTAVVKVNKIIYAGTLNGLLALAPGKKIMTPFSNDPMLKGRITVLCADGDSVLWVANNKAMLIRIAGNQVKKVIDRNTGLDYNRISAINVSDQYLWVGTDNGLYVINKKFPFNIIKHLSFINGLGSDQINCIGSGGGRVWVGTKNGLNYFDEQMIVPPKTKPTFFINGIKNDENNIISAKDMNGLRGKTLRIDFDVVDHEGGIKPIYAYSLNDNPWIDIERNSLYFPSVPYGNFSISIKAISSHWNAPQILKLSFYRAYPFYMSWWFILLMLLLSLILIANLTLFFLKRARKKDQEQLLIQQNLLQLEQLALQGQMNPHFIFNCITAIRQYYNKGNLLRANRFVDIFSALIRTTFEMVNQTFTSLENELNYLDQYLTVEQERFNQTFSFSIIREIEITAASIPVPAMLLQPLVENAVRHGVRSLADGTGKINIAVVQQHGFIHISVADNGIGRAMTKQMKQTIFSAVPVTSTTVNRRRIDILNKLFSNKISMTTEDITNDLGKVTGTRVLISYPLDIYVFE